MPASCRNCGEPVALAYCPRCGQKLSPPRGPLLELLGDFFSEFLSLDGRHLRTARWLAVPGKLTELYLAGKRASHVSPVRVYLVASLLFFLLVDFDPPNAADYNVIVDGAVIGRQERDPSLVDFHLSFAWPSWIGGGGASALDPKIAQLRSGTAQDFLDDFFGGLERTVPTALIAFVPILALALALLHLRRAFYYVEHLVFALHFQSFLFVALIAARLANGAGLDHLWSGIATYGAVFVVVSPVYLTLALRRVYRQSWPWSIAKAMTLGVLYPLLLQPVVIATAYLVFRSL